MENKIKRSNVPVVDKKYARKVAQMVGISIKSTCGVLCTLLLVLRIKGPIFNHDHLNDNVHIWREYFPSISSQISSHNLISLNSNRFVWQKKTFSLFIVVECRVFSFINNNNYITEKSTSQEQCWRNYSVFSHRCAANLIFFFWMKVLEMCRSIGKFNSFCTFNDWHTNNSFLFHAGTAIHPFDLFYFFHFVSHLLILDVCVLRCFHVVVMHSSINNSNAIINSSMTYFMMRIELKVRMAWNWIYFFRSRSFHFNCVFHNFGS